MFPNNSPSNSKSSANININDLNNNYSKDELNIDEYLKNLSISKSKIVIVTKHLCIPCPQMYTDIFKTILLVCKDPSHIQDESLDGNNLNDKIQIFPKVNKNVF
jgi:hypothetical protein